MLGRRSSLRGLFDVIGLPHAVDPGSFYGRMGAVNSVLFKDEDLSGMYTLDNGRPSLPPSMMCGVVLLHCYDDVSDGEAVERVKFDLRRKVALALPLDYPGFDPSGLSVFRRRLFEHGKERYAFDRFIAATIASAPCGHSPIGCDWWCSPATFRPIPIPPTSPSLAGRR